MIPAQPVYEEAFCAFARGSLVETDCGPMAIEDLVPGDHVLTESAGLQPITWIGATTLLPEQNEHARRPVPLHRIMPASCRAPRPARRGAHAGAGAAALVA